MAPSKRSGRASGSAKKASPFDGRELRTQGRRTMTKLLDAGMQVLSERGYHAARVDDVVRIAKVSHGTFYLYFANKEDLFRALATRCAEEMTELAGSLGPITPDDSGRDELRRWLGAFIALYEKYGVVIRAWMEDQLSDRELSRLGRKTFGEVASALVLRIDEARPGRQHETELEAAALLALVERFTYFSTSRNLGFEPTDTVDTLTAIVYRGFFAPVEDAASGRRGTPRLKLAGG